MAPTDETEGETNAGRQPARSPRERARAAQEAKSRALADMPEDTAGEETADPADIGEEHTPSGTDPANAPTRRDPDRSREDTEKPTRSR